MNYRSAGSAKPWRLGRTHSTRCWAIFLLICASPPLQSMAAESVVSQPVAAGAPAGSHPQRQSNWPHWRGPLANGVAPTANPPMTWGTSQNIRWKTPIPGEGSATPIVWQDQVFVIAAVPTNRPAQDATTHPDARTKPPEVVYQFVVHSLDRATGAVRWQRVVTERAPREGRHSTNTYASGSPTTDGKRLYVSFGSQGLFCLNLDGTPVWDKQLGQMRTRRGWGEAVTPVVHGDNVVVNWDHEDDSFILVLDAATGEERWRQPRDEKTSWNTPAIVQHDGKTQVIVNGTNRVRSYELATGQLIWECGGQTVNPIPSPLVDGTYVICMSGYRGAAAVSIPLSSKGDVTDSQTLRWTHDQSTPYVPSPVVYDGQVYFTRTNVGILTSLDAKTGEVIFGPARIPSVSNVYASPVAVAGRIYITGRDGTTVVLKHGRSLEVLSENRLDEPIDASPAIVDNQVFLRGAAHVYCIEEAKLSSKK